MKLNTLEKLYLCMEYEKPEILMEEELRLAAKKPIDRMLEISKQYGFIMTIVKLIVHRIQHI